MSAGTLDSSSDPPGGDRRPRVVRISAEREPYRTELTPVAFLRRSAYVFPEKTAVIHGARRYTYRLTPAYFDMAVRDVRLQLGRAGVRLAYVLNGALGRR